MKSLLAERKKRAYHIEICSRKIRSKTASSFGLRQAAGSYAWRLKMSKHLTAKDAEIERLKAAQICECGDTLECPGCGKRLAMTGLPKTAIQTFDYGWNFFTGCKTGCPYCWFSEKILDRLKIQTPEGNDIKIASPGQAWPYGKLPTVYPHRFDQPKHTKKPGTVAVCFQGDLMAWASREIIQDAIDIMRTCDHLAFFMLTKNPGRYQEFNWPDNCWLGMTLTGEQTDEERIETIGCHHDRWWLSIEPLLEPLSPFVLRQIQPDIGWLIVGAMTGKASSLNAPDERWVWDILNQSRKCGVPIFFKKSLAGFQICYNNYGALIQELPE